MRTEKELRQLALDILEDKVFLDRMCHRPETDIPLVFMPLGLMDGDEMDKFRAHDPALIYEYLEKAGPRSINGMPIFFSFQYLDKTELDQLIPIIKSMQTTREKMLEVIEHDDANGTAN